MTISKAAREDIIPENDDHQFFLQKGDPFKDKGITIARYNEWRALYGIKKNFHNHYWFEGARLSSFEEDGIGFDIIMKTSFGCIGVQVKSSRAERRKFRQRYGNDSFIILNLPRHFTPAQVKEVILAKITDDSVQNILPRKVKFLKANYGRKSLLCH